MKKIVNIVMIVVGAIIILSGFGNLGFDQYYEYESNSSYGGDAYTGIQNAGASTSRNVRAVGNALDKVVNSLGMIEIGIGTLVMAPGVIGLSEKKQKENISLVKQDEVSSGDDPKREDIVLVKQDEVSTDDTPKKEEE